MKKFISIALMAIFAFAINVNAQTNLVATLNHEGEISMFYGANAFAAAHEASTHGDVITLSSGAFTSTDITKAVTIRGAGMCTDTLNAHERTVLNGDIEINVSDTTHTLIMEGVYNNHEIHYSSLNNAQFIKCRFKRINESYQGVLKNAVFINCRFSDYFRLAANCSASLISCIIPHLNVAESAICNLTNCCTFFHETPKCEFKNCILISDGTYSTNASSVYYNNIFILNRIGHSSYGNTTNKVVKYSDASEIPNLLGDYTDERSYELTDEQKEWLKGTDGTEVGIHGGIFPYDPVPSYPRITKFNVAGKTTPDGKLKVEIEVDSAKQ